MTEKEIDLILKSFKWHVKSYYYCIDKLNDIAEQLSGELSSPAIRSVEEAKYQRGTQIYKNRTPELLDEEEKLIKERDYHAYAINNVYELIKDLGSNELSLLDEFYWREFSYSVIGYNRGYSKNRIKQMIDDIKYKIVRVQLKNTV